LSPRRLIVYVVAAAVVVIAMIFYRALTAFRPGAKMEVEVEGGEAGAADAAAGAAAAGDSLTLLTWNIGFAGLGAESDFFADGGRAWRAQSRALVERNARAIAARLQSEAADVFMIQELARGSWLTHGFDVEATVRVAQAGRRLAFAPVVNVLGVPGVGELAVGNGTFSSVASSGATRHALPSKPALPGVTLQHFNVLESRFPIAGRSAEWVTFNLHLAAFDNGTLRRQQLVHVLRLMEAEYAAGNHVIAGGDWNLRLAATEFPHTTANKAKFWVRDFPAELKPAGWQWGVDAAKPTCRTLEQPYVAGRNYRCVIDGFLVSPNVEVVRVETTDLDFAFSDHNPVRLEVRAK
jgi:endonuclease/exonuclease/phosphatase family metal-dependent hydrolase